MADSAITVMPAELSAAAQLLAGQAAALGVPGTVAEATGEPSTLAAVALTRALNSHRREFAQALSAVAAALNQAADSYAGMETVNAGTLNIRVPPGYP